MVSEIFIFNSVSLLNMRGFQSAVIPHDKPIIVRLSVYAQFHKNQTNGSRVISRKPSTNQNPAGSLNMRDFRRAVIPYTINPTDKCACQVTSKLDQRFLSYSPETINQSRVQQAN
jgi:hypothetical protein